MSNDDVRAMHDESAAHPIASAWRPVVREIVHALADGDYGLARGVKSVAPVTKGTADAVAASISSYGERLAELPEETWKTSVAQWMGTHWDVLVDLWTTESGPSDLVLSARVRESADGVQVEIEGVYVP